MRLIFIPLIFLVNNFLNAQELVKTDWEQGYVKDGKKYSVWQYFDSNKKPELVINHSTGKVTFISKDTTDYVIYKDGQWINSRLDVHPIPITGTSNFFQSIINRISQRPTDITGASILFFEIDTLGNSFNFSFAKNGVYDLEILKTLQEIDQKWIPARIGNHKYPARFEIDFIFKGKSSGNEKAKEVDTLALKDAKFLGEISIDQFTVSLDQRQAYSVVERIAEFSGGKKEFASWLGKKIKYPSSASRMGLEGKVRVEFILEPDGTITNPRVLSGFDAACDKEALRVVSIMPKWIPAQRMGKNVPSKLIQVIIFKLDK